MGGVGENYVGNSIRYMFSASFCLARQFNGSSPETNGRPVGPTSSRALGFRTEANRCIQAASYSKPIML